MHTTPAAVAAPAVPPVILFGPPRCGKTRNAPSLMLRLGCRRIVDEWDGRTPLLPGDLAVTSLPLAALERICVAPIVPADTRMVWAPRLIDGAAS